jgi:hypothetical protein
MLHLTDDEIESVFAVLGLASQDDRNSFISLQHIGRDAPGAATHQIEIHLGASSERGPEGESTDA